LIRPEVRAKAVEFPRSEFGWACDTENHMLTVLEKVALLQKAPLLQGVRTESLARVAAIAQEVQCAARQTLFRENEAAETMYFVVEGEVSLLRGGREFRRLGADQILGMLPLLAGDCHVEAALATGALRVLQIDQQEFYDAMADDFNLTRGILEALARLAARAG
jgi:CRP-like cAMP-binding protein